MLEELFRRKRKLKSSSLTKSTSPRGTNLYPLIKNRPFLIENKCGAEVKGAKIRGFAALNFN